MNGLKRHAFKETGEFFGDKVSKKAYKNLKE